MINTLHGSMQYLWSKIMGPTEKNTILILISLKRYFSHPEKSILYLSLTKLKGGIVIPGPGLIFGNI